MVRMTLKYYFHILSELDCGLLSLDQYICVFVSLSRLGGERKGSPCQTCPICLCLHSQTMQYWQSSENDLGKLILQNT